MAVGRSDRPAASTVVIETVGKALMLRTGADRRGRLVELVAVLSRDPRWTVVVSGSSVTGRPDFFDLLAEILAEYLGGITTGVRLLPLGGYADSVEVPSAVRRLGERVGQRIAVPAPGLPSRPGDAGPGTASPPPRPGQAAGSATEGWLVYGPGGVVGYARSWPPTGEPLPALAVPHVPGALPEPASPGALAEPGERLPVRRTGVVLPPRPTPPLPRRRRTVPGGRPGIASAAAAPPSLPLPSLSSPGTAVGPSRPAVTPEPAPAARTLHPPRPLVAASLPGALPRTPKRAEDAAAMLAPVALDQGLAALLSPDRLRLEAMASRIEVPAPRTTFPPAPPVAEPAAMVPPEPDPRPATPPEKRPSGMPRWISATEITKTIGDRGVLRQALAGRYDAHARVVSRVLAEQPGLRAGTGSVVDPTPGLVAVRAYVEERGLINRVLRGGDPEEEAERVATVARFAAHGLQRLPSVLGPVFRSGMSAPDAVAGYQVGVELFEPAFVDVELAPPRSPGTQIAIWPASARRLNSLGSGERGGGALFPPGSRFLVLAVDREAPEQPPVRVLLRELATARTGRWAGGAPVGRDGTEILTRLRAAISDGEPLADRATPESPAFAPGLDDRGRPFPPPADANAARMARP